MVGIFISYRRGEAEGQARALSAELQTFYGRGSVFIDVDSIGPGRDFRIALLKSIESCDAFLALIGPGWLDAKDAEGRRRLDDPKDFVREEIAVALTRDIPVVPILLQNVSMPRAENLPDDLKELAFRNAFELRHSRWHADVRDLVERLGSVSPALAFPQLSAASGQSEEAGRIRRPRWLNRRTAVGAAAAGAIAVGSAVVAPPILRWASKASKPSLRAISFDFATVDEKGGHLAMQKGTASVFTEPLSSDVGVMMVSIPEGSFVMGSPQSEPERRANEGPQRHVRLRTFFIGSSPVTQRQWAAVVANPKASSLRTLDPDPSFFKGADLPVETISWNEAAEFCRRVGELTGRDYRLPTEAEWEYACRAGSTGPFSFGPTITPQLANYCGVGGAVCGDSNGGSIASDEYDGATYHSGAYGQGPVGIFRGTTTVAGTFPPNRFGLYDMHGDVWEYCQDVATPNYSQALSDGSAYVSGDGDRILRGGSWSHNPAICRAAYRDQIAPDNRGWQGRIGLRLACSA